MATVTEQLRQQRCVPCEGGVPALKPDEVERLLTGLPDWQLGERGKSIRRSWRVRDFDAALDFFNRVARVANAENHHPDLHLTGYRNVVIEIWTHAIDGLSSNDFILAAKIDDLPVELKK
ncbi:MAG: 4a-hydroxytetrahydrobiopterin dehydratase [Gemmataceae bacterium]